MIIDQCEGTGELTGDWLHGAKEQYLACPVSPFLLEFTLYYIYPVKFLLFADSGAYGNTET